MTQDVEMKDTQAPSNSLSSTDPPTLKRMPQSPLAFSLIDSSQTLGFLFDFVGFEGIKSLLCADLKEVASLIESGSYTKVARRISGGVRPFGIRCKLNARVLSLFLDCALVPGSEGHIKLSGFLPKVTNALAAVFVCVCVCCCCIWCCCC